MGELQHYQEHAATFGMAIGLKLSRQLLSGLWQLADRSGRTHDEAGVRRAKLDPSLFRYIGNFVAVTLNIVLVGKSFESFRIYADAEHLSIHRNCG